jgi:GAF domain-containing protein
MLHASAATPPSADLSVTGQSIASLSVASLSVDDVLVTDELGRRPVRARDERAERQALTALAREMATNPRGVPQKLAELLIELCHADSAGISILEPGGEQGVLRWHAAAGRFARYMNGTMPRDASPCGTVLERNHVLLFDRPERCFPALRGVEPAVQESLMAPWTVDDKPAGTVWALIHTPGRQFDAEDARLLDTLASFASAAWQTVSALDEARRAEHALVRHIDERTRLLTHSIDALQQETAKRRRTKAALHATEARLADELYAMHRLYELHARLATESDLQVALDLILSTACEFTRTDRGCIQLLGADGTGLEIVAQRGHKPDSAFIRQFRCKGLAQGDHVTRVDRRRLLIEDARAFPGLAGSADGAAALADGILAAQSTPMVSRKGEAVGVLSTQFRAPHRPTAEELRLVDLLAWSAADFVERHQAQDELRRGGRRQAFLLELSDALRPLTDGAEIEGVATRLTGRYLGASRVLIGELVGDEVEIRRDFVDGVASLAGRRPGSAFGTMLIPACEGGAALVIDDVATDARLDDVLRARWTRGDIGALLAVGLYTGGPLQVGATLERGRYPVGARRRRARLAGHRARPRRGRAEGGRPAQGRIPGHAGARAAQSAGPDQQRRAPDAAPGRPPRHRPPDGHRRTPGAADREAGRRPARDLAHHARQDRAGQAAGAAGRRRARCGRDQPAAGRTRAAPADGVAAG